MAELRLKPLTPLGKSDPLVDEIGAVTIAENVEMAFASIAVRGGKEKPFHTAAKRVFKFSLPDAGSYASKGEFAAWWTGPEQWFVEAPVSSHEDIVPGLKGSFGESASITEQSGGWCRFDLSGDGCVAVLERLCAVDTATMETNGATRSVMEHIGVFLICKKAKKQFAVYGPRSSAGSLHHALTAAAKSIA